MREKLNKDVYTVKEIADRDVLLVSEEGQIRVPKYKMPLEYQIGSSISRDADGYYGKIE